MAFHLAAVGCSTFLSGWGSVIPDQHIHWTKPIPESRSSSEKHLKHKKQLEGDIITILFEHESMIRDYQAIMKIWFPKGKQKIIPTYGKHEGVKLVVFLDYQTGHVYVEEHKKYDTEVFPQFLKNVLSQYPNGKIVIILDNARIHHAKLLKEFLEENRNCLELFYLPPYSLNLNKIEELWGWLKDSVINNVFFHSCKEIQEATQKFIDWVTTVPQRVIDRLCL